MSEKAENGPDETSNEPSPEDQARTWSSVLEVSGLYSYPTRRHLASGELAADDAFDGGDGLDPELEELLTSSESEEPTFTGERNSEFPRADTEESERVLREVAAADIAPPLALRPDELRLDVDGRYPQLAASGTFTSPGNPDLHWIARLKPAGKRRWVGRIWYQNPLTPALPYTAVVVRATASVYAARRRARVTFVGNGVRKLSATYCFRSRYFHPFEFEVDKVKDAERVLAIDTGAHPDRPASLPIETLSIREVYQRAGFDTHRRPGSEIEVSGAGADGTWSDSEMHDAMQVHWSRFQNLPQWSMWVLFARQHDLGSGLGGIMFDDIGPNHRQGTAIFTDSFISEAPPGDPAPAAWVQRMRFWTACHEMGHGFNLAHSWQKELGAAWIPTPNEFEARSFMNYPYNVAGGVPAFFSDFEFRFSDSELLFMRHAPEGFVQMGNADWFDNHGFEQVVRPQRSGLRLSLSANRPQAFFEFLEPIVLELRLNNQGNRAQLIDRNVLLTSDALTVVIKKRNAAARRWRPYASYCVEPSLVELKPGQLLPESLFVSAGAGGWEVSEPGEYLIQVALRLPSEDVVSAPLRLRVGFPKSQEEDIVAQDYFTDAVGRVLSFDGTRSLDKANAVLRDITGRFPDHPAAKHAQVALALPLARPYRTLNADGRSFQRHSAQIQEASELAQQALLEDPSGSAETLGLADYAYYADRLSKLIEYGGDTAAAQKLAAAKRTLAAIRGSIDPERERVLGLAPGAAAAE